MTTTAQVLSLDTQRTSSARVVHPYERERLVEVLTRAFVGDPVAQWFICQDERRRERSDRLFRWFLNDSIPHGLTYTNDAHQGVALWIPPHRWQMPLRRQVALLPEILRIVGAKNALSRITGVDCYQRSHPKAAHYFLLCLGVLPELQGQGIGSALLRPMLERLDRERMPAYLEASKEANVPFYEKHGFRVTEEVYGGSTGPKQWMMWRDPR